MSKNYVCASLQPDGNNLVCEKWVVAQPSFAETFAITKGQAYELAGAIVVIFIICYGYKIVERNFLK